MLTKNHKEGNDCCSKAICIPVAGHCLPLNYFWYNFLRGGLKEKLISNWPDSGDSTCDYFTCFSAE